MGRRKTKVCGWIVWLAFGLGGAACDFLDDGIDGEDEGAGETGGAEGNGGTTGGDDDGGETEPGNEGDSAADAASSDGAADSGSGSESESGASVDESGDESGGACFGEVLPVQTGDRRFAAGYAFLQANGAPSLGLQGRSLCLGDCMNIQDLSVRSLCLAMVSGDPCVCMDIVDFNLRNVCQNACDTISTAPDTMNLCLGGDDCELIQDPDLRFYCQGACPLILDPNVRYLCDGACNLIN